MGGDDTMKTTITIFRPVAEALRLTAREYNALVEGARGSCALVLESDIRPVLGQTDTIQGRGGYAGCYTHFMQSMDGSENGFQLIWFPLNDGAPWGICPQWHGYIINHGALMLFQTLDAAAAAFFRL